MGVMGWAVDKKHSTRRRIPHAGLGYSVRFRGNPSVSSCADVFLLSHLRNLPQSWQSNRAKCGPFPAWMTRAVERQCGQVGVVEVVMVVVPPMRRSPSVQ